MAKKSTKKSNKEPTWDQIGQLIGKKVDKEFNSKNKKEWQSCFLKRNNDSDSGFIGRTLFIIGVLIALNSLNIINSVSIWIQIMIGIGFAFMKF